MQRTLYLLANVLGGVVLVLLLLDLTRPLSLCSSSWGWPRSASWCRGSRPGDGPSCWGPAWGLDVAAAGPSLLLLVVTPVSP
jgi:hypothetical protein